MNFESDDLAIPQPSMCADELNELWSASASIWNSHETDVAYEGYVSADFAAIYQRLIGLRKRATTFLEWGSGLGVVSIMASRLGFEAYGIEVKSELVHEARQLAIRFDAQPSFAVGSFIPDDFHANIRQGDEFYRTETNELDAYAELKMDLGDFDLIYAYPWPEEHAVFRSIVRRCAAPHALYLRYDAREGLSLTRPAASRQRRNNYQ